MLTRRKFLLTGLVTGTLALGGALTWSNYRDAVARARRAVAAGRSEIVAGRFGDLEYAEAGAGPPVLIVHGTGGGFDQGLLFAQPLLAAGYRVIAPSRFGYLRSAMPVEPSSEKQADAFVDLLDALAIERIAIAGGSAGALSALQFAIRHPDRCDALVALVPASYAPNRPPARPWGPVQTAIAQSVLGSDFLFWAGLNVMRDTMIWTLLATDPRLLDTSSPEERARVQEILWGILPVSARANGLLNDARLASNPEPMNYAAITAPTLAISLEDDFFLTADAARHIAASVEGARLTIYPSGGHVWVGREEQLFAEIDGFFGDLGYR